MRNLFSRLPSFTTLLWIVASLVAFGAFLYIAPILLIPPTPTVTPTNVSQVVPTAQPTSTVLVTTTPAPIVPTANNVTRAPTPPIPPGAQVYSSVADPTRSGYLKANDEIAHWGDRNLHAGFFGNEEYKSVLFFDISSIPPNSEILSAELDLTGLSRDNLGAQGEWRAGLIRIKPFEDWEDLTPEEFEDATVTTSIGNALTPTDLELGRTNEIHFTTDQLPGLANELGQQTYLVVLLEGPEGPENNLFTWDSGGLDLTTGAHPSLNIIARAGQFVIVTNTPTAETVVTAAAIALQETDFAGRFGTVTPFPRTHATGTPIFLVTRVATPLNVETRVAIAQRATAIAITTGTYTPTPDNWVEVTATFTPQPTRTPQTVAAATLYARLTPTVLPSRTPTIRELLLRPLPEYLKGNLLIYTDRFYEEELVVMRPDGTIVQGLTGDEFYELARIREQYSPDRQQLAVVAPDDSETLQIWIEDDVTKLRRLVTHQEIAISYDPVWSPDGGRIAFVSRETGVDEIYVFDIGTETIAKLTSGGNPFMYKQKPTWSPDGNEIAFMINENSGAFSDLDYERRWDELAKHKPD